MVPPRAVQTHTYGQDAKTQSGGDLGDDLLVQEGESGYRRKRLTRSIHMVNAVKSAVYIVCSDARGGCENAHRGTGKNSTYSEVLVRIRCSCFSCEGMPLQALCTIPP